MTERVSCGLCVIGAGSGGLSVAAAAARMGVRTVLIERGAMGGDCLNTGCVPSKALIAAARTAHAVRTAGRFGVGCHEPEVDFAAVHAHVRSAIAAIAPHDSQERFEGLGVRVIRASARFTGPKAVEAGGVEVRARRFVLATGSRAAVPSVPGLDGVPYLTNETLFERLSFLTGGAPGHLIVLGGGPVGVEMAQAFRRFGCRVTLAEKQRLLPRDDPELVEVVRRRLAAEGVALVEGTGVAAVRRAGNGVAVVLDDGRLVEGSDLLVAAGRRPNVEDLNLDAAGIEAHRGGIQTDKRLRTSNPRVYAVGDVTGGPAFTHVAGYHAALVVRNALFRLPAREDYAALPWVTYSDPELAQVGPTEAEARAAYGGIEVLRHPFADNDRARTEGETDGFVKLLAHKGRVVGASIVGAQAGEQIALWCLAVATRAKLSTLAGLVLPYPTRSEAGKRAAGSAFTPILFGATSRMLVRVLSWFG